MEMKLKGKTPRAGGASVPSETTSPAMSTYVCVSQSGTTQPAQ